jgi:hypothetical protein
VGSGWHHNEESGCQDRELTVGIWQCHSPSGSRLDSWSALGSRASLAELVHVACVVVAPGETCVSSVADGQIVYGLLRTRLERWESFFLLMIRHQNFIGTPSIDLHSCYLFLDHRHDPWVRVFLSPSSGPTASLPPPSGPVLNYQYGYLGVQFRFHDPHQRGDVVARSRVATNHGTRAGGRARSKPGTTWQSDTTDRNSSPDPPEI